MEVVKVFPRGDADEIGKARTFQLEGLFPRVEGDHGSFIKEEGEAINFSGQKRGYSLEASKLGPSLWGMGFFSP
jgi:hypothetical protein